jgi:hypothetical protein
VRSASCHPVRPGTGASPSLPHSTRQPSGPFPGRSGAPGYTVLELVVVSAIGLLVLSFSVGGISRALAREELDGWARAVAAELTAAQQAAMTRRTSVTASFQHQVFTVVAADGGTLRSQDLPAHISFGAALQAVTFDRRGVPSGASTVTLTSTRADKTYTIRIQANTGRVTVND